jgi:hypothetical protein
LTKLEAVKADFIWLAKAFAMASQTLSVSIGSPSYAAAVNVRTMREKIQLKNRKL